LSCFRQALFVLVRFRERRGVALAGRGLGISQATAYRYRTTRSRSSPPTPSELVEALKRLADDGWSHVILDGKVIATDRLAETTTSRKGTMIDAWYSGKTHDFGGNIQDIMRPDGLPIWVSDVEPGSAHDLPCARQHVLGALYAAASQLGLPTLADGGYTGAGIGVHTPSNNPLTATSSTHRHPHLQHTAALATLPRRTRLRPTHRPLAHPPAHHRQPQARSAKSQSVARPHPLRAQGQRPAEPADLDPASTASASSNSASARADRPS
jgi:DDE superfamily endonuclease